MCNIKFYTATQNNNRGTHAGSLHQLATAHLAMASLAEFIQGLITQKRDSSICTCLVQHLSAWEGMKHARSPAKMARGNALST